MSVLDRSELQDSPLADLHAIADQLGLEGFRRLRKADLIDAILGEPAAGDSSGGSSGASTDGAAAGDGGEPGDEQQGAPTEKRRRRPSVRGRRPRRVATKDADTQEGEGTSAAQERPDEDGETDDGGDPGVGGGTGGGGTGGRSRRGGAGEERPPRGERPARGGRGARSARGERSAHEDEPAAAGEERAAEGVVELLGNGSAFLRVHPPEASDEDVYISAAQVRRCELVSGDRVSGPLRTPRRSERYSSLVRVETINGAPAGEVSEGGRYDERPVAYPSERLPLDGGDATLQAIEWLTPFGRGSRVIVSGPARAGKTEILRRLLAALATDRRSASEGLEVTLLLAGVRPEEVAEWGEGLLAPATTLSFAASADAQGQAVERAIETAKRTAARGGDALVLIDTLDGLHPHTARKVLAAARNLADGGSLTIVATATRPYGGETTVIALDPALAHAGGPPLDLTASGTVRAELLVGEEGAAAIAKARASALAQG
jgi:transcription termination factor Rho